MDLLEAYRSWWRPLPAWLKLVTVLGIYPAWCFIIYCVFADASKSLEAIIAFGVCMIATLLHMMFDCRNREDDGREHGGLDFLGGE